MASAPGFAQALDQAEQRGRFVDRSGVHRLVDAGQVLQNDPTGADVQMADFGVPHLAFRQTDILAGRMQDGMWAGGP